MKTAEELNALKEEYNAPNKKLSDLSKEELLQVSGGTGVEFSVKDQSGNKEIHIYKGTVEKDFLRRIDE